MKDDGDKKDVIILFFCLNEGCVKMYEWYLSFEKYLFFGKCRMMFEKENLLDKVKRIYYVFLKEDISMVKVLEVRIFEVMDGVSLLEGWVLKIIKKFVWFNEV